MLDCDGFARWGTCSFLSYLASPRGERPGWHRRHDPPRGASDHAAIIRAGKGRLQRDQGEEQVVGDPARWGMQAVAPGEIREWADFTSDLGRLS